MQKICLFYVSTGRRPHVPMEKAAFEGWLESVSTTFLALSDQQRNQSLDHLISLSGAAQLRHLSNRLEALLKRDFLRLLPLELAFYLLRWLDPQTLLTCCLVCKQWNKVINACTEVWQSVCRDLGWRIDESIQDATHWKGVYVKAKLRMKQLREEDAFETSSLIGHSARVYALYYQDGLLCTGALLLMVVSPKGGVKRRTVIELIYCAPYGFMYLRAIKNYWFVLIWNELSSWFV